MALENAEVLANLQAQLEQVQQQLEVGRKYYDHHKEVFGYAKSNVTFLEGNIEKLEELGLEPNSFDLIISNCVINLAQDKDKVLTDAYRLLKPGGEMYFSDVYSDRRVPKHLQDKFHQNPLRSDGVHKGIE